MIGQYSVLFNENFLYSVVAKNHVRLLSLDQQFFLDHQDDIEGLKETIVEAEAHVEKYGLPICDFRVLQEREKLTPKEKFKRAVNHVIILNRVNTKTRSKFLDVLQAMQEKIAREKYEEKKKREKLLSKLKDKMKESFQPKYMAEKYKNQRRRSTQSDAVIKKYRKSITADVTKQLLEEQLTLKNEKIERRQSNMQHIETDPLLSV